MPEDYAEAYAWYTVRAAEGYKVSAVNREKIRGKMSQEQVAEGERRAKGIRQQQKAAEKKRQKEVEGKQQKMARKRREEEQMWQRLQEAAEHIQRDQRQRQQEAEAQFDRGVTYAEGRGVLEDYVEAYALFVLASANGSEKAIDYRNNLRQMMTPEQIAAGQQRAKSRQQQTKQNRGE